MSVFNIPLSELRFTVSRSSGPGGQHVNKVSSRVTLQFNVGQSPYLDESQRRLILQKLANRINSAGTLQMSSQSGRSQFANKQEVIARFYHLINQALHKEKPRRPTKIPKAVKQRRLDQKKKQARLKQTRRKSTDGE